MEGFEFIDVVPSGASPQFQAPTTIYVGDDGRYMYTVQGTTLRLRTGGDIWSGDSITSTDTFSNFSTQYIYGIWVSNDGTILLLTGSDRIIEKHILSTPWDPSTASLQQTYTVPWEGDNTSALFGCFASPEIGKIFVVGRTNCQGVIEITLTTPGDLDTASVTFSTPCDFIPGVADMEPSELVLVSDGTIMYLTEVQNGDVFKATLSTAYRLDTAVVEGEVLDIVAETEGLFNIRGNGSGISARSDNSKFITAVTDDDTDTLQTLLYKNLYTSFWTQFHGQEEIK